MRRLPGLNRRRAVLAGLLAVVMSMGATAAWGYWLATGTGSGSATTGALVAPTGVTAAYATGTSSVTVSWTASAGSPAPTGYFATRIRTSDGSTSPACGTSASSLTGAVTCTDPGVPNGTYRYSVTAVYRSWTAASAPGNPVTVAVATASATTTTLSSSSNPSVVGQTVTYTATVSPTASTGTVTFKDGSSTIACTGGNRTLSSGSATCQVSYLTTGSRSITAVYGGDATHLTSASSALTQAVNLWATTTTLVASPTSSVTGQSVTLTATVTVNSPGIGTPTGSVTFSNGGTTLCSAVVLTGSGVATCTISTLPVGTKTLSAVYSGSTTYSSSTGTAAQSTTAAATTTTLTSSASNVAPGVTVTYTAMVGVVAPGSGSPTGTVSFRDNGSTITCGPGSQALGATGTATCQASYPTAGAHPMTAVFTPAGGDYLGSTSAGTSQKVSAVTGIAFSSLNVGSGTAACTGLGTSAYSCPVTGAANNAVFSTQVVFVDALGAPVVVSATVAQTVAVAYGKNSASGPTSLTVTPNTTTSTGVAASVTKSGSNDTSITLTYGAGAAALTATLTTN